jgi:transcriptional regulator GlxA family with amidase domain
MVRKARKDRSYRVGFLLVDGFALMSYASASEPLRAANELAGLPLYTIRHIPAAGTRAASSGGAVIEGTDRVGGPAAFDLVLVMAGGDPTNFDDDNVFQWLRHLARHGVVLGGVSGGPVILAAARLMAGRRMTVHWEHAPALAELSPSLMIERTLYVLDRDRLTCAGGTAPLDMMLALIGEHRGAAFASRVSDWFMHTEIRPSRGAQRAGLAARYGTTSAAVLHAIEAMENHIADPLSLPQLATLSDIGARQLNRLFRDRLGQSTMAFYRRLRLEKAHNLLIQSPLSITDVALATGFSGSAHFATAFRGKFDTTPSSIRP